MKTISLFAVMFAALSAPAFATHAVEKCVVKLDLSPYFRSFAKDDTAIKVRFVYHTNMTDLNPLEPEVVTREAAQSGPYRREVTTSPEVSTLVQVRVQSARYNPENGHPLWEYSYDRTTGVIDCVSFAD
jgi:hypothetical protein